MPQDGRRHHVRRTAQPPREQQRRRRALEDDADRAPAVHVRNSKIAGANPRKVGHELARNRLVEPEALAHERVVTRVAVLAGEGEHRISRSEMYEQKCNEHDAGHRRHHLEYPPQNEGRAHSAHFAVATKCEEALKPLQRMLYTRVFNVSTSQMYG